MRGKEASRKLRGTLKGITPAYAGKSQCNSSCTAGKWDHPRVCGEKESVNDGTAIRAGSPPRMRGKARSCQANTSVTRITPAYAGKSRICTADMDNAMGSPPRMRGKAGSRSASGSACRDHPRVCGEKQRKWMPRICTKGSPPRMRGKGIEQSNCRVGMRITPAYAGKRRLCVVAAHLGRDHPRVCGEKCAPTAQQNTATGSPPRMRGKAGQIQSQTPELGITPAYAGKS